jgi:hypothetical protein
LLPGIHGLRHGTVEVDEDQLVLHPESGRIKSVDSCVQDYNYERPDEGLEDETLFWEIGDDGYGNTVLVLSTNGNGGSVFHPEE